MKICIISHYNKFDLNKLYAGGDIDLYLLAQSWKKSGEEIILSAKSIKKFSFIDMLYDSLNILTSKEYIKDSNCDIIIGGSPYPTDFILTLKIMHKLNIPAVIYFHHIPPSIFFHPIRRGLLRVILNRIYFLFAISLCKIFNVGIFIDQPQAYDLGSLNVYKNDGSINEFEQCLNKSVNTEMNNFDILFLGRVNKPKGIYDMIKVMKILQKKGLKLIIAGGISDKKYFNKLINKIEKSNLDSFITFLGYVTEEEKINLFKKAKIFLFPSYEEGWAISVMEAARYCVPIVAYDLPAYSYLNDNFFKVPPGDIKKLAEAIEQCLENKELREKYVKNAYQLVLKYNYKEIANDHLTIFKHLVIK